MLKKKFQKIKLADYAIDTKIKFGTSGIRGFNKNLTDKICYIYTIAFLNYLENTKHLKPNQNIIIAGDLRENTDHILRVISAAILTAGFKPEYEGKIPTPALCYYCIHKKAPGMIVTGSHIPHDMNGIKFYKIDGEILKVDEKAIMEQTVIIDEALFTEHGALMATYDEELFNPKFAYHFYVDRYLTFFPPKSLTELKIGVYAHSSVAIAALADIFQRLGATLFLFGKTKTFYSIDTEALKPEDLSIAKKYVKEYKLDMVISTDGDGDRPMLSDENGNWLRGDIIGMLTAIILQANFVVTPFTSNSSVEHVEQFKHVYRTRIGSPFVIEKINELIHEGKGRIIGYEANGGVIIGTDFLAEGKILKALPTRDSLISLLCIIIYAHKNGKKISEIVKKYARMFTFSQSIEVSSRVSRAFLMKLFDEMKTQHTDFFEMNVSYENIEFVDGLRIYFKNGEIIHLRPSGNAPELRCYTEAASEKRARELNQRCVEIIKKSLTHES